MALIDNGYTHTQSSQYDASWATPRLDSSKGFGNGGLEDDFWLIIDFASVLLYVHSIILMKRADGNGLDELNNYF